MEHFAENLSKELKNYLRTWEKYRKEVGLPVYTPSTVGWKTKDINEFTQTLSQLLSSGSADQCHEGWVDKRYIASIVFFKPIFNNVYVLKLMQRRPNSTDPVGLDHVDFYVDDLGKVEKEFQKIKLGNWDYESNESHRWISLRYDKTEAKFVDHLVLDVCVQELRQASQKIGFAPKLMSKK